MDRFPYIRTLLKIRLKELNNVKTIVDVGAYTGEFLKDLSKDWPDSIIHAIEPDDKCAEEIRRISLVHSNIKLHRLAISSKDGEVTLYSENKDGPSASNTIYEKLLDHRELTIKSQIPCMTFKSFCDTKGIDDIDLLILNAEGAEYEMFECDREAIVKSKIIDLSLHGKSFFFNTKDYAQKRLDINNFLISSGYKIIYGDVITSLILAPNHIRQVWIS